MVKSIGIAIDDVVWSFPIEGAVDDDYLGEQSATIAYIFEDCLDDLNTESQDKADEAQIFEMFDKFIAEVRSSCDIVLGKPNMTLTVLRITSSGNEDEYLISDYVVDEDIDTEDEDIDF